MFHLPTVQKCLSEAQNSYVKNLFKIIVNRLDKKLVEFYISWEIDSLNQDKTSLAKSFIIYNSC